MKNINDPRHQARRLALGVIYAFTLSNAEQDIQYFLKKLKINQYDNNLYQNLIDSYKQNTSIIDTNLAKYLESWNKDQLLEIDILIIKLALIEYNILKTVPVKVAVDEAVELAKEFSADKSGKFVNGVLAKIIQDINLESKS